MGSSRSSRPLKMKTLVAFFGLLALANGQCCMGGTLCPAGCCPEADWFCCENNWQCAPTEADCCRLLDDNNMPVGELTHKKILQMNDEEEERCCPNGTDCPAGCCPGGKHWFCCADNLYCAPTEEECP